MPSKLEKYIAMLRDMGMVKGQVRNFYNRGYAAQRKQAMFHALAREADSPNGPTQIGFGGARGGGKTHATFAQLALDDCQRVPGLKALMLRKIGKAVQETVQDLRTSVLAHTPHEYKRGERVLYFPNGSRIILGNFKDEKDIESYIGLEYDAIVVEEATTLTYSKYKAIRTCLRTSKQGWRPRLYATTNPGGIGHAWYKKRFILPFTSGNENKTRFIPATVYDNAHVNPEYRESLEDLTGWLREAWLHGNWDISAGQFFTTWNEMVHKKPWFKIPENWRVWLSYDYGFTHHSVFYLCAENADTGDMWFVDEHYAAKMLVPSHAVAVRRMLAINGVEENRLESFVAGADVFSKRGVGEYSIAELWGNEKFSLTKANQDRINGAAEFLLRMGDHARDIDPTIWVTERCPLLIETIPSMIHDPRRPEDVLKIDMDEDGEGGDDAYEAARYGLMEQAAARSRRLRTAENPFY